MARTHSIDQDPMSSQRAEESAIPRTQVSANGEALPRWVIDTVHPSWIDVLVPVSDKLGEIDAFLRALEEQVEQAAQEETAEEEAPGAQIERGNPAEQSAPATQETQGAQQTMLDLALPAEPAQSRTANHVTSDPAQGAPYLPAKPLIFNALRAPLADVRVVILGQDPYPTPGHAMGLSFATNPDVRPIPRSLNNIYAELADDLGITTPEHGDLSKWSGQGVLLLNRVLTVAPGAPGSHQRIGWEHVTEAILQALVERNEPLVVVLWGNQARSLAPMFANHSHIEVIESAHPSPLSARRGFFGSKPFSRSNDALQRMGAQPVDWRL